MGFHEEIALGPVIGSEGLRAFVNGDAKAPCLVVPRTERDCMVVILSLSKADPFSAVMY